MTHFIVFSFFPHRNWFCWRFEMLSSFYNWKHRGCIIISSYKIALSVANNKIDIVSTSVLHSVCVLLRISIVFFCVSLFLPTSNLSKYLTVFCNCFHQPSNFVEMMPRTSGWIGNQLRRNESAQEDEEEEKNMKREWNESNDNKNEQRLCAN